MKFIISHDVDHITVFEHYKDLIIPKFIARTLIEFLSGNIKINEVIGRFKDIYKNKWNNIEEIAKYNKANNINTTFFFGVTSGRGLVYSNIYVTIFVNYLTKEGFRCGVHAINFSDELKVCNEYNRFKEITGLNRFGVRTHYLKMSDNTLVLFSKAGYTYDSSVYQVANPYKVNNLWEFPLCLMDGKLFYKNSHYQNQSFKSAVDQTLKLIDYAYKKNIKYFTVLFHDRYFSDSFKSWKYWYIWLIEYIKKNNFKVVTFDEAIEELEKNY